MIKFAEVFGETEPSEKMLATVQDEIGLALPEVYIDFLNQNNGGVPIQKYGMIPGRNFVVEVFFPLLDDDEANSENGVYDIINVFNYTSDRLGGQCIPFASLFGGDMMCFWFGETEAPSVQLWNHELSEFETPHLTLVAENFSEFVAMLRK